MKRFLTALLGFTMALSPALTSPARAEGETPELAFNGDGEFTVLVLADPQDTQFTVSYLANSLNSVLNEHTPDLVIVLGDLLEGGSPVFQIGNVKKNVESAIQNILAPVVSRGIPFAVVFGNHDAECGVSREEQLAIYRSYPNCVSLDEAPDLPGCGTCVLPVRSSDGASVALNLFLFDSGDYTKDGEHYGCVTEEQVAWYRERSDEAKAANGGRIVPAAAFQHIVVAEIYDALDETQSGTPGALKGVGSGEGRWFSSEAASIVDGALLEAPCPSNENYGQFEAFREQGDVFAAFFGHDHLNSYLISHRGIDLVASPGATYTSYNSRSARGVRLIRFFEDDVPSYQTLVVPFSQYESVSMFGQIPYYLGVTTAIPNVYKVAALAVIFVGALAWLVIDGIQKRKLPLPAELPEDGEPADD